LERLVIPLSARRHGGGRVTASHKDTPELHKKSSVLAEGLDHGAGLHSAWAGTDMSPLGRRKGVEISKVMKRGSTTRIQTRL